MLTGLAEVRRVEKMREKRAFEDRLPAIDDVAQLPLRQRMVEAWEQAEWAEREAEILGVQEQRLELLEQALQVRLRCAAQRGRGGGRGTALARPHRGLRPPTGQ